MDGSEDAVETGPHDDVHHAIDSFGTIVHGTTGPPDSEGNESPTDGAENVPTTKDDKGHPIDSGLSVLVHEKEGSKEMGFAKT